MDEFLGACGASGALRLCVEAAASGLNGDGAGARVFEQPFAIVGRDPRCDLVLEHPEISPRHVYFQVVNGRLLYIDLGSRAGVLHAGKRRKTGWLAREESLRIGPYRVRLQGGDVLASGGEAGPGALTAEAPIAFEDARVQDALGFELSHRAVRRTECAVRSGLALIGSGADCPIRLVDPSVATYHAALIRAPAGAWVVDLLGEGGVRLNGRDVRSAKLVEGDAIQLGHSVIRLTGTASAAVLPIEPAVVLSPPALPPPPAANGHASEPRAVDDAFVFGSRRAATARVEAPAQASSYTSMIPRAQATELLEEVLAPMVRQIGLMQEQMVGEFHQARAALYETFTTLHQEQSTVFHHELDQLRQLAQDLTRLRGDLERLSVDAREAEPIRSVDHHRVLGATGPPKPVRDESLSGCQGFSEPVLDGPPPRNTGSWHPGREPVASESSLSEGQRASSFRIAASAIPRAPIGPTALTLEAVALERAVPAVLDANLRVNDENVHNQICDRIVQIREDQQSPWRKLLGLLPGAASAGRSTP